MRFKIFIIITLAAMLFGVGCEEQQQQAIKDITSEYPNNAKVFFDNDYVKAVEFNLKPGEKLPLHKGKPRVVYALSDYTVKWGEANKTGEKQWQKGDVHWHNAQEHSVENIGDSEASFIVVARKEAALPATGDYSIEHDASAIDAQHSTMVFDNESVRVIKVNLPPRAAQPEHSGINRLVYSLSDYEVQYTSDKTEVEKVQLSAGSLHWHPADKHAVENVGTTPAQYLIFAFKK